MSPGEKKLVRIGNYIMTGKVLGKGHFARVEEATHCMLNVKVAIKIINFKEITDAYVQNNLRREARIMSNISHPNIIFLFEALETSKNYYLVTELGSGGDLCNYVKSQRFGKLDEPRARPLARQLVSAVGHLHERGIVHRDLKMENILLDAAKEKIKLVDFGLSNFCKFNELLRTHCGSPEYAAPELYVSGRKYGPEVDIWSLCVDNVYGVCLRGIIFYGMMVGKLPFQTWYKVGLTHEERRQFLMQETKKGLTFKHQRVLMDFSYLFRNLITKMLNPNAKDRISIHELQIHAWVHGNYMRGFAEVDDDWQNLTYKKIATLIGVPYVDITSQVEKDPYGPVGGLYNIEKHSYLISKLYSDQLRNFRDFKNHSCGILSRPMTSRCESTQSTHLRKSKPRPKTSDIKNCSEDLKATSNYHSKKEEGFKQQTMYFETKTPQKSNSASSKMFNFFNEKISQAFNIYTKKNERKGAYNVDKMDILPEKERPKTVPSTNDYFRAIGNLNNCRSTDEDSRIKETWIAQNDISSENSSSRQTARTRFIKYLCSPTNQQRPQTTPNKIKNYQDTADAYTCYKQPNSSCGVNFTKHIRSWDNVKNQSRNKRGDIPINHVLPTKNLDQFRRVNHLPEQGTLANFTKKKSGIPTHTAARAAIRKEYSVKSNLSQGQNRFIP